MYDEVLLRLAFRALLDRAHAVYRATSKSFEVHGRTLPMVVDRLLVLVGDVADD